MFWQEVALRWSVEAEELLTRAPGFVQPMARRRVEKLAGREGLDEIDADAVRRAMPRGRAPKGQALADLVKEAEEAAAEAAVQGRASAITVCGGLAGCPLAVGDTQAAFDGLKDVARSLALDDALFSRMRDGVVLSHERCKVTVSACPNGCSEPQIKDVALVARVLPEVGPAMCDGCGACVHVCPDACVTLDGDGVHVDEAACSGCGRCVTACRQGALVARTSGWDVLAAGRLGRHPRLAGMVNDAPLPLAEALATARRVLAVLIDRGRPGERLAAVVEREGEEALQRLLG